MTGPSSAWLSLACVIGALALNVCWQIAHCRLTGGRHFLGTVAAGFVFGGLALAAGMAFAASRSGNPAEWILEFPTNIFVYGCLGYGYANFVNLGQSSIRIRLFEDLRNHPNGVEPERIRAAYDETGLVHARLARLTESGDLKLVDGRYTAARKRFVVIASVIFWLKKLILGTSSEFEAIPR